MMRKEQSLYVKNRRELLFPTILTFFLVWGEVGRGLKGGGGFAVTILYFLFSSQEFCNFGLDVFCRLVG